MKICFSTAGLFPRPTLEALQLIAEAGYDGAEIMPQCGYETTPRFAFEITRTKGIPAICSIHFPLIFFPIFYNPYPKAREESRLLVRDVVAMAERLQSSVIVIHPLSDLPPEKKALFTAPVQENICFLCERAAKSGIRIAIENSPTSPCRTPEGMKAYLSSLNCPNVFPMLDTTEAMECGIHPTEFLRLLDVIHLHVSDHSDSRGKHLPPGKGDINWTEFVSLLKKKNFQGCFVVEPEYTYFLKQPEELLRETLNFLRNLCIA
jgi:sugar phosphate isomerase/epimerase